MKNNNNVIIKINNTSSSVYMLSCMSQIGPRMEQKAGAAVDAQQAVARPAPGT
jgi:hypothetical protein